ncbi:MAG: DUF4190 domain-containing protein [Acidimicrobiales bacterium]|nr:DUF4190 domain-containing protein [Acidimicrobiales bacterium]
MSYQPPAGPPPSAPPNNQLAVGSIIASAIGLLCGIGSIIGIVLGVVAKNQIKASNGTQGGDNLATLGIVIGAVGIVLNILWRVLFFN